MVPPEATVSQVTIEGVTYTPVINPRMYFRSPVSSVDKYGSNSRRGKKKTVRKSAGIPKSAPQGSKDLSQMRGRESPLPDQRTSKKRKRNQSSSMQKAGKPSDNHENADEDGVVAIDEAEFERMICSKTTKGSSAKKGPYIEDDSSEEMEVEETNEPVSRSTTAGRRVTKESSSKWDVNAVAIGRNRRIRKNADCQTKSMSFATREYDDRSDRGPLNQLSGSFLQKGNVKNSEGFIIEEDEPRIPMPVSVEYVGMSSGTQSRTRNMEMSPETDDNLVINVSSSSSECRNRCSGDDGVEVTSSHSSDGAVSLSLYHEDIGVQKNYFSTEETGHYSKRDENSIEHVQKHFNEEEAEEQCNEVDDAIMERGHQVQTNESSFAKQKVPLGKSQCSTASNKVLEQGHDQVHSSEDALGEQIVHLRRSGRSRVSKKENKKKAGEHNKVRARKNKTAATKDATVEKGSSRLEGLDRSPSCTKRLIEEVHPVMQTRMKPTSAEEMCRFLTDAIFGTGPRAEDDEDNQAEAPSTDTQNTVPWKFSFDDGIPEVIEKTEEEKEKERLFDEMDLCWHMDMPQTSQTLDVNTEHLCSDAEETHEERCKRGEHEFMNKDDEGQVCIHCFFVGLGPREVCPDWGEKSRRRPSKRPAYLADLPRFEEDPPKFEQVQMKSLVKRDASSFNIPDDGTVWDIKPGVRECMYQHQQEGFEFMWRNLAGSISLSELKSDQPRQVGGCIISHAPGTGKTRLTITFLETYMKMFPRCQPLIIAPAGMLLTWQEEFEKWNFPFPFYDLRDTKFSGMESPFIRKQVTPRLQTTETIRLGKAYSWDDNVSVLGISYQLFELSTKKDKTAEAGDGLGGIGRYLKKILLEKPGLAILDEGHYPRNASSNIWKSFLNLKTEKRVVLSGTPFQNNCDELCNTLRLVRPAVASMLEGEKTLGGICMPMSKKKNKGTQSASVSDINLDDLEKLKSAISPFVNVHKGTILRDSLPGLKEVVISLKPPSVQKKLIEKLKELTSLKYEHLVSMISVHPYLLQHCGDQDIKRFKLDPSSVKDLKLRPNEGAKTKFIFELLRHAVAANEKVLIFSQYIDPLNLLRDQLKSLFNWVEGEQILLMSGETAPLKRQAMINFFNDPCSDARVLLASTKCCNEGINLVGASRVVLMDVVWNPSVERQAISRAYRIGQKKVVYTYHLLTSGSYEGYKYSCQIAKLELSDLVFSSSSGEPAEIKSQATGIEDRMLDHVAGQLNSTDTFLKVMSKPTREDLVHQ